MIKLVQAGGKPISGIMTSTISGQTIKILKSAQPDQDGSQVGVTITVLYLALCVMYLALI